ncbi:unnamed protein product [Discula destructiva]
MARSYVGAPNSAGCQLQGFLIQMFLSADAYWTLAMALNVYLTFYRKFDAAKLRRMEIPYLLVCYGAPFIVALTYIFIETPKNGRMYGNALLWCWVSTGWDVLRIATFYGPVWITIFITVFIYLRTGREIYRKYKALRSLDSQSREPDQPIIDPFSAKKTEVFVTSEIVSTSVGVEADHLDHRVSMAIGVPTSAYKVEITAAPSTQRQTTPAHSRHDEKEDEEEEEEGDVEEAEDEIKPATSRVETDFIYPTSPIFQYPYSPTSPTAPITSRGKSMRKNTMGTNGHRARRQRAVYEANNAAWSYTKCALLFFTALLITWIPSTANRVYSVVNKKEISLGLEIASALVLPLQGFWNALIYIFTTRRACKELIGNILDYMTENDSRKLKAVKTPVNVDNRLNSWSGPSNKQLPRDRHSFVMGFVPKKGTAGLGLPVEPYERI